MIDFVKWQFVLLTSILLTLLSVITCKMKYKCFFIDTVLKTFYNMVVCAINKYTTYTTVNYHL